MIRRFNYTGRKKIPRSSVQITVFGSGEERAFDAHLSLVDLRLPAEAAVFVEAYHRSAYRRYDFGTVTNQTPPRDRRLAGIPSQNPLFRVKVVVQTDGLGRIVAAAEKIVAEDSDKAGETRQSLLIVEYVDLNDRVWALDLDSDWPRLQLNSRLSGIRDAARGGHEFLALVYPEVLSSVLSRVLTDDNSDPDCDDDDWGTLWLRFACWELGQPRPTALNEQEAAEWVRRAVNAFCSRKRVAEAFGRLLVARGE